MCKQSTLYKKNVSEVLKRQVNMAQKGADVWLGKPVLPTEDIDVVHLLDMACMQSIYEKGRLEVISCPDVGMVWREK